MMKFEVMLSYTVTERYVATVRLEALSVRDAADQARHLRREEVSWLRQPPLVSAVNVVVPVQKDDRAISRLVNRAAGQRQRQRTMAAKRGEG